MENANEVWLHLWIS